MQTAANRLGDSERPRGLRQTLSGDLKLIALGPANSDMWSIVRGDDRV